MIAFLMEKMPHKLSKMDLGLSIKELQAVYTLYIQGNGKCLLMHTFH